jgi:hypothetical protein
MYFIGAPMSMSHQHFVNHQQVPLLNAVSGHHTPGHLLQHKHVFSIPSILNETSENNLIEPK